MKLWGKMYWVYNIGIFFYALLLRLVAPFNTKAHLFVSGRKGIFTQLKSKINPSVRPIWFHFASLGEFEQGRPVLEKLKSNAPSQSIVVTFFSPSGYEIRKNYALADVFYLPLDTASNAKKFIEIVNPKLAIFTKYEFWFHYFNELHQREIPLYLISGIFRPNQSFFKWYGGFYRSILKFVTHYFVQNEESATLLKSIGITQVTLSGDTRFDRVFENAQQPKEIKEIGAFCGDSKTFIAGSTWPEDEQLLVDLVAENQDWKFIIAPHEIGVGHIGALQKLFPAAENFSAFSAQLAEFPASTLSSNSSILIIDNIGMLSSLYQYAQLAYIGGGFGAGIHNTLEAAAFGLPVIFGPKYDKFQEAKDLVAIGAAKSINNANELKEAFDFFNHEIQASTTARNYVATKKGATNQIVDYISSRN